LITDFDKGELVHLYWDEPVRWLVPICSTLNYFECEIISKGKTGCCIWIGIGQRPTGYDARYFHYYETVVSYRVDNGHVHRGNVCSDPDCKNFVVQLHLSYSEGDRIGCGIDFECHSDYMDVFFVKNGMQVGDLIRCKKPSYDLCPIVGMGEVGEKIRFLKHCYQPSLLSVSHINKPCTHKNIAYTRMDSID
jgi:hypothetical protein